MLKFGRQGAQVEQVDGSVDFSGFSSRCSRCSRCFEGPYGASIQELEGFLRAEWARAVHYNEQSRYAISNRIGTTASVLQHSAENLRGAGHAALKKALINDH